VGFAGRQALRRHCRTSRSMAAIRTKMTSFVR
jgi:hypothetical protein